MLVAVSGTFSKCLILVMVAVNLEPNLGTLTLTHSFTPIYFNQSTYWHVFRRTDEPGGNPHMEYMHKNATQLVT